MDALAAVGLIEGATTRAKALATEAAEQAREACVETRAALAEAQQGLKDAQQLRADMGAMLDELRQAAGQVGATAALLDGFRDGMTQAMAACADSVEALSARVAAIGAGAAGVATAGESIDLAAGRANEVERMLSACMRLAGQWAPQVERITAHLDTMMEALDARPQGGAGAAQPAELGAAPGAAEARVQRFAAKRGAPWVT